jgi:hypothetical protein
MTARPDISQAAFDRILDVLIELARERVTPFAWCWYDAERERYEFALSKDDAPEGARPLFTATETPR